MEETVQATEGVVAPEATNDVQVEEAAGEATAPGTQESQEGKQEQPKAWSAEEAQKRIDRLTREKYEARGRAQAERDARLALERDVLALNKEQQADEPKEQPPSRDELLAEVRFDERCNRVANDGEKAIPGFKEAIGALSVFRPYLNTERMEAILEADEPAKVLHYLGTHLDEASEILSKPPIAMARAVAKLETKLSTTPAISKAPLPLDTVRTKADVTPKVGTDAWYEMRDEQERKRKSR